MTTLSTAARAYELLLSEIARMQVVLLHPQSKYRSFLVSRLLNSTSHKVFYYALSPNDIDIQSLVIGMVHMLSAQRPLFGRHLCSLPNSIWENPSAQLDTIVDCFVREFNELSSDDYILVLDEYDRSDSSDEVQQLFEALFVRLPTQTRIVLNSRQLPRLCWVSLIVQNKSTILMDDSVILRDFYGFTNRDEADFEIFALGPGFIKLGSQYVEDWEGYLPRLLFFYALDRPLTTRTEICSTFWPDLHPEQAVNVFHVTKRRLHKALGRDVLVHEDGYYRISDDLSLYYDILDFASSILSGRSDMSDAEVSHTSWNKVIDLYRGPFLQGHEDKWIQRRRMDFRTGYVEAIKFMSDVWKQRQKPEMSMSLLQKAYTENTRLEHINFDIMDLYMQMGRRSEAAAHYQRIEKDYQTDNTLLPEKLQTLYYQIIT
jgi:DNA-binding SARP family transcriptional activator